MDRTKGYKKMDDNKTIRTMSAAVIRLLAEDAAHTAIMRYKARNPHAIEVDREGVEMMGIYEAVCAAVERRHHCDDKARAGYAVPSTTWASALIHGQKTLKEMDDFLGWEFYGDGYPWRDDEYEIKAYAAVLGRKGGKKGGKSRSKAKIEAGRKNIAKANASLTAEGRQERARKAAAARWSGEDKSSTAAVRSAPLADSSASK